MNITNDDISLWGGILVISGVVFSCIKGFVVMKEKIRVLDSKVDELEALHDKDVVEIKAIINGFEHKIDAMKDALDIKIDTMKDSNQQAQKELIDIINKNHVSVLEKMNELKK